MSDYTPVPNVAVAFTLAGIGGKHGKRYSYPSQAKIAEVAAKHYGWRRSRATITRHTRALERAGLIRKTCRHQLTPGRGWTFRSTLYTWTRRGWRWLASLANAIRGWAADARRRGGRKPWLNSESLSPLKRDSHGPAAPLRGPPGPENVSPAEPATPREEAIDRLEALRRMLQGRR